MAIVKKAGPSPLPLTSSDYVAQNLLQTHDKLNLEQPIRIDGSNVLQGALFQIGETYYYAESATAITGTPSDYVKITPSVDTLTATASFASSLSGVTWNASYGGYYDSSDNLYIFDEQKALQATAISTIMTRYVQQDSAGDVVIGNDLDITRDVSVGNDLDITRDVSVGNDASFGTLNISYPISSLSAGDNVVYIDATENTNNTTIYKLFNKLTCPLSGTLRIKYEMKSSNGNTVYGKLNIGTEQTTTSTSYVTISEDISVSALTEITLSGKIFNGTVYIRNLSISISGGVSSDIKNLYSASFKRD